MTDTNTLAPTDDLQKRCAEIIGWYRTGVLVGDTLRSHAESKWPGDIHNLQMAERATENEALCFIAKWGAPALASQPFAYEFSRSNGDGTHSEHIERGRLQEVAPGRWEHSGLPRGALADKPIKALYTTPQTQPAAVLAGMEPVAWLIVRSAFRASPDGQDAEGNEWLEEAQSPEEPGAFAVFTAAQAQDALKEIGAIAVSALETNSRYIADWREDMDRIAARAAQKGTND